MFNRIKELRKVLNLNQQEFAKKIGVGQSTLGMIEVGKRTVNDRHVKLICSEFNVNEEWLRTGSGEMFNTTEDLIELFGYMLNDMTEIEKDFMIKYLRLPSQERQMVVKYLKKLTCD